jgi:hypothetical protein
LLPRVLAAYYWLVPLVAARAIANAAFVVESVRVASPTDQGFQLGMRVAIGPLPVAVHVDASVVHLLYGPDLVDLGTTSLPAIDLAAGRARRAAAKCDVCHCRFRLAHGHV